LLHYHAEIVAGLEVGTCRVPDRRRRPMNDIDHDEVCDWIMRDKLNAKAS
jgi:hypothetical protein